MPDSEVLRVSALLSIFPSMDLDRILAQHEGKTLEFKRDLSSPKGVLRTLVAFANTAGGVLLIGVDDRTRRVHSVSAPLDSEERLANIVSDGIRPLLSPEVGILPWREAQLLLVEVFPSSLRPHHVVQDGPDRGVYVRVGLRPERGSFTSGAKSDAV